MKIKTFLIVFFAVSLSLSLGAKIPDLTNRVLSGEIIELKTVFTMFEHEPIQWTVGTKTVVARDIETYEFKKDKIVAIIPMNQPLFIKTKDGVKLFQIIKDEARRGVFFKQQPTNLKKKFWGQKWMIPGKFSAIPCDKWMPVKKAGKNRVEVMHLPGGYMLRFRVTKTKKIGKNKELENKDVNFSPNKRPFFTLKYTVKMKKATFKVSAKITIKIDRGKIYERALIKID